MGGGRTVPTCRPPRAQSRAIHAGGHIREETQTTSHTDPPSPALPSGKEMSSCLQLFNLPFQAFLISVKSLAVDLRFEGWVYLKMKCFDFASRIQTLFSSVEDAADFLFLANT